MKAKSSKLITLATLAVLARRARNIGGVALESGDVIITSRVADWSTAVQPVELDVLAEEDAAAFLLERSESRRKKMLTDSEDAAAVAHDLGGLALALDCVVAIFRTRGMISHSFLSASPLIF